MRHRNDNDTNPKNVFKGQRETGYIPLSGTDENISVNLSQSASLNISL